MGTLTKQRGRSVTRSKPITQERNLSLQLHATLINDMYKTYKQRLPGTPKDERPQTRSSTPTRRARASRSISQSFQPGADAGTKIISSKDFPPDSLEFVLYRATGLLNKLTSANFAPVAAEVLGLINTITQPFKGKIDKTGRTADVTKEIIELIVDKALDEALFSKVYVRLLAYLADKISPTVAWRLYEDEEERTEDFAKRERLPLEKFIMGGSVVRFILWSTLYDEINSCTELIMTKPYYAALTILSDETQAEYYYMQKLKHRRVGLAVLISEIFLKDFVQPRGYMSLCLAEGQPHDNDVHANPQKNDRRPIRSASVARSISRVRDAPPPSPTDKPSPATTRELTDIPANRASLLHSVVHPFILLVPHEEAIEYLSVLLNHTRFLLDFKGSPSGELFNQYHHILAYSLNFSGPEVTSRAKFMLQDMVSSHDKRSGDLSGVKYLRKSFRNVSPHI